jgi:hypothetical protein
MTESLIARFRQEQALQEEAAHRALSGPALIGGHALIAARMDQASQRLLGLLRAGQHEEVLRLMSLPQWGLEEQEQEQEQKQQEQACRTTTPRLE